MKTLRRILIAVIAAALTCLMAGSCGVSKIKDIKLVSAGVKYIIPTSLRTFDAKLDLEIDNPAMTFNVTGIDGTITVDEVSFATFTAGQIRVEGKQTGNYELPCYITLEPGISLIDVMKLYTRRSLEGIKADINLKVETKNGTLKAPLSYKNLDLAEFSK
ncbi:MAG: hypothetical protein IJU21_03760 [Bacteroidales bacterium]|nr:hypothetical protein [Bacteroidales bacterium]